LSDGLREELSADSSRVLILDSKDENAIGHIRSFMFAMMNSGLTNPVIIRRDYSGLSEDNLIIAASIELGSVLLSGFADGLWIESGDMSR
ncbi:hypothetical protein GUG51_02545, partial [Xanthomonas citri pv. citri]|nr:hypothetical protein [Xanthomonas citri pv. citri]